MSPKLKEEAEPVGSIEFLGTFFHALMFTPHTTFVSTNKHTRSIDSPLACVLCVWNDSRSY